MPINLKDFIMRHFYTFVLVFMLGSVKITFGQETLSLTQCYQLTRENYPLIHQHGLIDQSEGYRISNIGKGWLPQLSVNAQASYQSAVTELPFDEKQLSSLMPDANIPAVNKDQYRVVIQIDQTIWDGGSKRATKALTKAEAKAQREQLDSELYKLRQRINELYFGCLLHDELIGQNHILQNDLKSNIIRIRAMITDGVANQSDLECMQVELLNARQKEIELRAERKAFRRMLGAFMNKQLDETVSLSLPELPRHLNSSAQNRPEMRALEAQNEILQTRHRQLNAGLMPRFSAFLQGGYGRPALNMLSNDFEGFYVAGIRLSWNLGKLYTLRNERREIDSNRKMIDWQKETFLFNTQLLLAQQDTEIQKMYELMQADEEIIRLRNNIKKAAEIKLENGVIAVTDLIREINAENLARQKAAMHRIQHVMSCYKRLFTTN